MASQGIKFSTNENYGQPYLLFYLDSPMVPALSLALELPILQPPTHPILTQLPLLPTPLLPELASIIPEAWLQGLQLQLRSF